MTEELTCKECGGTKFLIAYSPDDHKVIHCTSCHRDYERTSTKDNMIYIEGRPAFFEYLECKKCNERYETWGEYDNHICESK